MGLLRYRWWILYPLCVFAWLYILPLALDRGWFAAAVVALSAGATTMEAFILRGRLRKIAAIAEKAALEVAPGGVEALMDWYAAEGQIVKDAVGIIFARIGYWTAVTLSAFAWCSGRSAWFCAATLVFTPWTLMIISVFVAFPNPRRPYF